MATYKTPLPDDDDSRAIREIGERAVSDGMKSGRGQDTSPYEAQAKWEAEECNLLGKPVPEGWVEERVKELYRARVKDLPQDFSKPKVAQAWYPGTEVEQMLKATVGRIHEEYHKQLSKGISKEKEEEIRNEIRFEIKRDYEAEIKARLEGIYSQRSASLFKSFMMMTCACIGAVFFNILPDQWKMLGLLPLSYVFLQGYRMNKEVEKMLADIKEETKVQ